MRARRHLIPSLLCCLLCVLAGSFAIAPTRALADTWTRIYGEDAYGTMQACVQADNTFEDDRGGTVIVATGDGYWDALAASGLAGTECAPIITTYTHWLGGQAYEELKRLNPDTVIIMGGTYAISDNTFGHIEQCCPTATIYRVYGEKADDTAVAAYWAGSNWGDTCVVATVNGYWDALSIAPYAYSRNAPIFLTNGETGLLSETTVQQIRGGDFKHVVIVGGTSAVPAGVEGQLWGMNVTRLAGESAIDTSKEIALWEVCDQGMSIGSMGIATSGGYWDALAGAPLVGFHDSILVLAADGQTQAIDAIYSPWMGGVFDGYVFGGEMAVSDSIWQHIGGQNGGAMG